MLSWLFKKRVKTESPPPAAAKVAQPSPRRAAPAAAPKAATVEAPAVDWSARLQAAQGDDAALLALAKAATLLDIKLAAVTALASEEALKQAEREFRNHDRKVHRIAKQRLEAAVTQREARAQAQALLQRATALLGESTVPVNHLVALDREWAAIASKGLEPAQATQFAEVRARLDEAMRQRDEEQQRLQRWTADARQSLPAWRQAIVAAAEQGASGDLDALRSQAQALAGRAPELPVTVELEQAVRHVLELAEGVELRLAWWASQPDPAPVADAAEAPPAEVNPAEATGTTEAIDAGRGWSDLPTLADAALMRTLDQRHQQWERLRQPESPVTAVVPPVVPREPRAPKAGTPTDEQRQQLEGLLQQAESALAEGQLTDMQRHLQALEAVLSRLNPAALSDRLRARHQALRAERARLKDWQQWGGVRARDELLAEAERLAQLVVPVEATAPAAAADLSVLAEPAEGTDGADDATAAVEAVEGAAPDAPDASATATAHPAQPEATPARASPTRPRLKLKPHADAIQVLRKRWKALDHQGDVASPELWKRFDAALTIAYQPVAAQFEQLKAARLENLQAREALLATLEAVPVPGAVTEADGEAVADAGESPQADTPAAGIDWRGVMRELDRFHLAWRKLGPLEHTVPTDARSTLQQRLRAVLDRVETPLREAQNQAAAAREDFVSRAEALLPQLERRLSMADATRQVRDLQAEWQEHARQLPLPRALENALWARFKAATDAVFAQREASFAARDVELAANLAACEALVARLEAVNADTPVAEIARTLAEVDRAWRQGGELPRGAIEAVEPCFRAARAAATQWMESDARRRWEAQCDGLLMRVRLCEEREDAGSDGEGASEGLAERWPAAGDLPKAWEQALSQRWARDLGAGPLAQPAFDELLLQLEAALDQPTPPEWQEARRTLKLRALKDAMEGRGAPKQGPAQQAEWLRAAVLQGRLDAGQRQRLHALLMALRRSAPGALGSPTQAG
jgi:hypothetical protein